MEFEWWEVWKIRSLTVREKMLMFRKGHHKKEKEMLCRSMVWSTHLQSWVKMLLQALDKAPMWCVLLILWLNLICTTLFLGFLKSYMLEFDISLWASLLNTNNFAFFFVASFKSTNMKWSDIKTNSYIWDSFCYNK